MQHLAQPFFIGREITQAEYRWIEMLGQGPPRQYAVVGARSIRACGARPMHGWIG